MAICNLLVCSTLTLRSPRRPSGCVVSWPFRRWWGPAPPLRWRAPPSRGPADGSGPSGCSDCSARAVNKKQKHRMIRKINAVNMKMINYIRACVHGCVGTLTNGWKSGSSRISWNFLPWRSMPSLNLHITSEMVNNNYKLVQYYCEWKLNYIILTLRPLLWSSYDALAWKCFPRVDPSSQQ